MSNSMASGNSLKQFFENIATAKVAESGEYMLATKDGKVYRVVPVTKTSQLVNDSEFATKTQVETAKKTVEDEIPTKVSELQNDSGYITNSALEPYAKTEDVNSQLANKADKSDIPTKVSQLENDSSYTTTSQVNAAISEVNETISDVEEEVAKKQDKLTPGDGIDITNNVVSCTIDNNPMVFCEKLPTTDIKEGKIYCIPDPDSKEEDNLWIEYYWKDDKWELMGKYEPVVDLTPYLKIADAESTYETQEHAEATYETKEEAKSALEPYDLKEDRVALIESTEDETYVEKVVDAEGNLLMGFKENGEIDVPIGLTDDAYDLIKALAEQMGVVIPALQEWAGEAISALQEKMDEVIPALAEWAEKNFVGAEEITDDVWAEMWAEANGENN